MNASYSTKNNFISHYKSFIDNSINKKDRDKINHNNINNSLSSYAYKEKYNNQNNNILNTSYIKNRSRNTSPCLCHCHLNQHSLFLPEYNYTQDYCVTEFTKTFLTKSHEVNKLKSDLLTKVNKLKINLKNFEHELNKTKNEKKTLDLYRKKIEKEFSLPYTNKSFNNGYKTNQDKNYSTNNNDKYSQMIYKNLEALDNSINKSNEQRRGIKGKINYNFNNNNIRKDYNNIIESQKKWLDTLNQNYGKSKNNLNDKIFTNQNEGYNCDNNNYYFDYTNNNINTINNPEVYTDLNDKSNINNNKSSTENELIINKVNSKVNYDFINNYSMHINNQKEMDDKNNEDYSMIYPGNSIHRNKILEQTKQIMERLNFKDDIDNTNNNNTILNKSTLNNQDNNDYNKSNNKSYDNNYQFNYGSNTDNNYNYNYNSNIINNNNNYNIIPNINNNSNKLTYQIQYHTFPNVNERSNDKNLIESKDNIIKNNNFKNEKYVILDNQGNPIYANGHRLLGIKLTKLIENRTNSLDKSSNIMYIDQNGNPIKIEDLKPIILDNKKPLVNEENKPLLGLNGMFVIDEENNPICGPNELYDEQNKVIQGELGILPRDKKGNLITTTITDKNENKNEDSNKDKDKQKKYTPNLFDLLSKNKNINNIIKNTIKSQTQIKSKNNSSKYYPNLIKTNKSLDKILFKNKYKFGNNKIKNNYKTTPIKRYNRKDYLSSSSCFACDVGCSVSKTGYSLMTYSPFNNKIKRKEETPLKDENNRK